MSVGYNSIYQMTCPQCASVNARSARECDSCGFSFVEAEDASPLAQALEDEKLYEDYLAARALQTAQTAIAVQSEAAVAEAEQARADLAAQTARVAELTQELARHLPPPAAAPAPQRNIAPLRPLPGPQFDIAAAAAPTPVSTPPREIVQEIVKVPVPPQCKQATSAAPAPQITIAEPTRIIRAPLSSRAEEVANAAEALKSQLAQLRSAKAPSATVAPVAAAPQAPKVSTPVAVAPTTKQCVNCDSAVPHTAARCACGFSFIDGRVQTRAPAPASTNGDVKKILERAKVDKKARQQAAQAEKAERIRRARAARETQRAAAPVSSVAPSAEASANTVSATANESDGDREVAADIKRQRLVSARALVQDAGAEVEASIEARTQAPVVTKSSQSGNINMKSAKVIANSKPLRQRECPNCTANVADSVAKCKCGFEFTDLTAVNPMPGLVLDAGDAAKVHDLYPRRR